MNDIKDILNKWYLLYEDENPRDVKQSIIFDYFNDKPELMFNAALWLSNSGYTALHLKEWICEPSFEGLIASADQSIKEMKQNDREILTVEFILWVSKEYDKLLKQKSDEATKR